MESSDDNVCRVGLGRQANGFLHLDETVRIVWRGVADTRPERLDGPMSTSPRH